MAITIDTSDIKRFERDLNSLYKRALPFANRNALNNAAFAARKVAQAHIKRDMINRNQYTIRSVRVNKAKGINVRSQMSVVGSIADYMETQEFGGVKRKKSKHGVVLPTSYSAGQAIKSKPRMRLPRGKNKLEKIMLSKSSKRGKNRAQRNIIAFHEAAAGKDGKMAWMNLGKRKGIFKIVGGKKNPRARMVHSIDRKSVKIPKSPWLKPSVDKIGNPKVMRLIYAKALQQQIARQRLFQKR